MSFLFLFFIQAAPPAILPIPSGRFSVGYFLELPFQRLLETAVGAGAEDASADK